MMYKYVDSMGLDGIVVRHIIFSLGDAVTVSFPDVEDNFGPERQQYLEWLAEGNTPEPWESDTVITNPEEE